MAVVLLGPLFNTLVFCTLILSSWIYQLLFGRFPNLGSRFIAAFGVQSLLDPFWIFVVDMSLLKYKAPTSDTPTADVSKLYWHFVQLESSGIAGVFITLFLYVVTIFITLSCFYMYFLRVHMNGRLIDIYIRLKSSEDDLFMPHDMEVSLEELGYICRKAEQWRGIEGERKKINVCDYIWDGNEVCTTFIIQFSILFLYIQHEHCKTETATYISIYTIYLDGLTELYRHFLKIDSGAIIEVNKINNADIGISFFPDIW